MGHYTKMEIQVVLTKEIPEDILFTLQNLAEHNEDEKEVIDNPLWLWKHKRNPLTNYNGVSTTEFFFCEINDRFILKGYGEIKNYNDEYDAFLRLFMPYFHHGITIRNEPNYLGVFEYESGVDDEWVVRNIYLPNDQKEA